MASLDNRKSISEQLKGCGFVEAWVEDLTWPPGTYVFGSATVTIDAPIVRKVAIKKALALVPYKTWAFGLIGKINLNAVGDFGPGQVLVSQIEQGGKMTLLIRDVPWNHPALPRIYSEIEFP